MPVPLKMDPSISLHRYAHFWRSNGFLWEMFWLFWVRIYGVFILFVLRWCQKSSSPIQYGYNTTIWLQFVAVIGDIYGVGYLLIYMLVMGEEKLMQKPRWPPPYLYCRLRSLHLVLLGISNSPSSSSLASSCQMHVNAHDQWMWQVSTFTPSCNLMFVTPNA